jgi:predicted Zn-dependent protease
VLLGEIAAALDSDPHAAVQVWREGFAATLQPVFLQKIEDLLIAGGDPEAALEVFRAAAAEFPDQLLVRFFLAKLLFRLELRSEAEREFKQLAQLHPESPTLSYYLGRLAERRGDTREAANEYRRVIRAARALDIHYRCAHCHEKQDEWADRCARCSSWNALAVEWRDPSVEKSLPVERPRYLAAGG